MPAKRHRWFFAALAVAAIAIAGSVWHAQIRRFLGAGEVDGEAVMVLSFVLAVALLAAVATAIAVLATRARPGSRRILIRVNLVLFLIEASPVFGWMVLGEQALGLTLLYVFYAGLAFWPLLLLAALVLNLLTVLWIREHLPSNRNPA